jgi:membrane glycosyltransferase
LPEENLGWEENPPTLIEFIRRDLRWCQGNMQYWSFIALPRLHAVSRYQLAFAILMFLGSPAWIAMFALGVLALAVAPASTAVVNAAPGLALFASLLAMWFAPQIATAIDVLLHPHERRAFGGPWRFVASVAATLTFNLLLAPVMWLAHTIFLARLLIEREPAWSSQQRDEHAVPLSLAIRRLWPQMLLGWAAIAIVGLTHPAALPYVLVLAGGLALAVPFAVITSWPGFGWLLMRLGLGRLPEEIAPPPILRAVALPALTGAVPPIGTAPAIAATPPSAGLSECSPASGP